MQQRLHPAARTSARLLLTLPLPPSINEQYAEVGGHRVSPEVARRFKREVRRHVERLEREGALSEQVIECFRRCYLALYLQFYFSTPLKRDLDGGLKITIDALVCASLGANDNRVVDIHLSKFIAPNHERLEVEQEAIEDWQFDEEDVLLVPRKAAGGIETARTTD